MTLGTTRAPEPAHETPHSRGSRHSAPASRDELTPVEPFETPISQDQSSGPAEPIRSAPVSRVEPSDLERGEEDFLPTTVLQIEPRATSNALALRSKDDGLDPVQVYGPAAIKPYCGAKATHVLSLHDAGTDRNVHGRPIAAWADVGLSSHMKSAVVPAWEAKAPEGGTDAGVPYLRHSMELWQSVFKCFIILVTVLENLSNYLAYFESMNPDRHLYNKYEAHAIGLQGLCTSVLIFALLNTVSMLVGFTLVVLFRIDAFFALASCRIPLSFATLIVCVMEVFIGEQTMVFAFLCSLFAGLHLEAWVLYPAVRPKDGQQVRLFTKVATALIALILIVWCVLFSANAVFFLHNRQCVTTVNSAMPVRLKDVVHWQCAKWGQVHHIIRVPKPGSPVLDAFCTTDFYALQATAPGVGTTNSAYFVRCPSQCQALGLGSTVVGCKSYHASSSVCSAAVQMGVLQANRGGTVTVVARASPEAGFERCNQNGILSSSTVNTSALNLPANVSATSFYFQGPGTEHFDVLELKSWKKVSDPSPHRPWRSYVASVSWTVGGVAHQSEVTLGPPSRPDVEVELNFCRSQDSGPSCE